MAAASSGLAAVRAGPVPRVTALVVDFDTEPDLLAACLGSLAEHGGDRLAGTVVLDNGSTLHRHEAAAIGAAAPNLSAVREPTNLGFAGGVNRGLAHCHTDYVLLLNSDATLTPGALPALVATLDAASEDVVAVTPKLIFAADGETVDAAGSALRPDGQPFNVGIGQIDIGQFGAENCFGACFAAVLVRREAFRPDQVGLLDERLFMYLEDVDWCWRARLAGRRIILVPEAVVEHVHSASTRRLPSSFKRYLIERNLLLVAAKNAEPAHAVRIWARRLAVHAWVGLRRHECLVRSRAVAGAFRGLPGALADRPAIQRRRCVGDAAISPGATGEELFFDPATYAPLRTWAMLAAAHRRRARVGGDPRDASLALLFDDISAGRQPPRAAGAVADLLAPAARAVVAELSADPRVTVIVVDHESGPATAQSLRAVLEKAPDAAGWQVAGWQVIVVQNGPTPIADQIAREVPDAEVMLSGSNIGYGAAVNAAAARAKGRYLWLLNPDVALPEGHAVGSVPAWLDEHPGCALASPRLLVPGGGPQPGQLKRAPSLLTTVLEAPVRRAAALWPGLWPLWGLVSPDHLPVRSRDVPFVAGAAPFVRRSAFEQVGGFDPAFFVYYEDDDLQRRLRDAGWTIRWIASSSVVHLGGTQSRVSRDRVELFFDGQRRYFSKWSGRPAVAGLRLWQHFARRVGAGRGHS